LDEAKRQCEELKRQQPQPNVQFRYQPPPGYEYRSRSLPDGKTVVESYPIGQNVFPQSATPAAAGYPSPAPVPAMVGGAPPIVAVAPAAVAGAAPSVVPNVVAVATPSVASEGDATQLVRNAFTASAERLEAAMKRKSEAMDQRLQAKEPAAIE